MDDLDRKIIEVLNRDARLSFRDLAKELDTSVGTISSRIKRMEKEGILKGYVPIIDPEKVGFGLKAVILVRISKGQLMEVEEKIAHFSNITEVYDITGDFDALIVGVFKDRSHLNDFVKKIQTFENVERTNTLLVLNTVKQDVRIYFD